MTDQMPEALRAAFRELPVGMEIRIVVKKGLSAIELWDDFIDESWICDGSAGLTVSEQILECLQRAKEEASKWDANTRSLREKFGA